VLPKHLSGLLLNPLVLWAAGSTGPFERPRPKPVDDGSSYDRLDTWVLKVSIAIPLVALTVLLLFHLLRYAFGKLKKPRVAKRSSPEPPSREPLPGAAKSPMSDAPEP
jgi:hypothetical protein